MLTMWRCLLGQAIGGTNERSQEAQPPEFEVRCPRQAGRILVGSLSLVLVVSAACGPAQGGSDSYTNTGAAEVEQDRAVMFVSPRMVDDAVRQPERPQPEPEQDPVPVPSPTVPVVRPAPYAGSIQELICSYAWPCEEALSVARCESALDPNAYNAGNYGVFQINSVHAAKVGGNLQALFDPVVNVDVAYRIWLDQGWGPWACRP